MKRRQLRHQHNQQPFQSVSQPYRTRVVHRPTQRQNLGQIGGRGPKQAKQATFLNALIFRCVHRRKVYQTSPSLGLTEMEGHPRRYPIILKDGTGEEMGASPGIKTMRDKPSMVARTLLAIILMEWNCEVMAVLLTIGIEGILCAQIENLVAAHHQWKSILVVPVLVIKLQCLEIKTVWIDQAEVDLINLNRCRTGTICTDSPARMCIHHDC